MVTTTQTESVWNVLHQVMDPEVPVLSVVDLGIVRKVENKDSIWHISICPTYSGCPALDVIAIDIHKALTDAGFTNKVAYVLDEPWTSDWMSKEGKAKLKKYGIAPPQGSIDENLRSKKVECPMCSSKNTELISAFGSTACKAMYRCKDCLEPFDYFKCK